ncbi:Na+-dependent transporter [Ramlibacter sp. G-1-2-2]|uniref:Na+-dependent transporter n=1 Tax=Ramlibacter agri TaxID=2728837 RepID=A0A848H1C7_9BURK|nr:Na+-dependent transporter [Ramlibacter agri]NML44277.1 Na+-dependent transporter [Ramlibacter agri]
MSITALIGLALQLSMALIICSVALEASFADLMYLWRRPGLLVRSLVAMLVVMPLFATAMLLKFDLNHAVVTALLASAISPVPPILPNKQIKAGGEAAYVIGLLTTTALVAIVYVPLSAALLQRMFQRPIDVEVASIVKIVATSMLLPALAGMAVHEWAPKLARRIEKPLSHFATVVLVLACIPILIKEWPAMGRLVGDFSVVAMVSFAVVGLAVGHLLGGPSEGGRTVLALATASRHPAVAIAITHNAIDKPGVMAAVLLSLLVGTIVAIPYVRWRQHSFEAAAVAGSGQH